jgi:hypothetical protein
MCWIIDRFEGDIAVVESRNETIYVNKSLLPEGIREGSLLVKTNGNFYLSEEKTAERRRKMQEKMARLKK